MDGGKKADLSAQSTMQEMEFKVHTQWQQGETDSANGVADAEIGTLVPQVCTSTNVGAGNICSFDGKDNINFYGVNGAEVSGGDSGTPISYNNRIIGIAIDSGFQYNDGFQHFTLWMDRFVTAINKVIYPNADKKVAKGTTTIQSFTIAVQNFTSSNVTLNPSLVDGTGQFAANVSACTTTLASKEGCIITATFDPMGTPIETAYSASIDLGGYGQIPVKVSIKSTNSAGSDGSSGGGGGSTSVLALLALAGLSLRRRK